MMEPPTTESTALDAVLEPWKRSDAPGFCAAVRKRGAWYWRGAAGLASIQSGNANTVATRHRIGSITKQFLCATTFMAAREGRLNLGASVRFYVPELPEVFEPVSILQLTNHTSGIWCHITTGTMLNGRGQYPPPTDDEVFKLIAAQTELAFAPGTQVSYSNGGSFLLSRIIERIEGKPLEEVFQERLFRPIGMTATTLMRLDSDFLTGLASLHLKNPDGVYRRGYMPVPMGGEGGAVSTLDDMMRWLLHFDQPTAFSPEVSDDLDRPVVLDSGFHPNFRHGQIRGVCRGLDVVFHDGGVSGGMARAARLPQVGLDIVILANSRDLSLNDMTGSLVDAALGAEASRREVRSPSSAWSGAYHAGGTGKIYSFERQGQTIIIDINGQKAPAIDCGAYLRADRTELANLVFRKVANGDELIEVEDCGKVVRCRRIDVARASKTSNLTQFAGHYRCVNLNGASANIGGLSEGIDLELRGDSGVARYKLSPQKEGVWRALPAAVREPGEEFVVEASSREGKRELLLTSFRATLRFESPRL